MKRSKKSVRRGLKLGNCSSKYKIKGKGINM